MFHRRNIILWHNAAGNCVVELEPTAALHRFDINMNIANLSMATAFFYDVRAETPAYGWSLYKETVGGVM